MKSTKKKSGRKQKTWINTATGLPVAGLTHRPDGRWRIIGSNIAWTEPDEQRAILQFYDRQRLRDGYPSDLVRPEDIRNGMATTPIGSILRGFDILDEDRMWKWFADQIQSRPRFVATKTGIEQIGYLTDLNPPIALPPLKEFITIYGDHAKASPA